MNKLKQTDGRFQRNLLENVIIYKFKKMVYLKKWAGLYIKAWKNL